MKSSQSLDCPACRSYNDQLSAVFLHLLNMNILFLRHSLKLCLTFVYFLISFMIGIRDPAVVLILTVTRGLHHLGCNKSVVKVALLHGSMAVYSSKRNSCENIEPWCDDAALLQIMIRSAHLYWDVLAASSVSPPSVTE